MHSFRIYAEVALLRDAYYARKPNTDELMNGLVRMLIEQESVCKCRIFTELPEHLRNGSKTHPKQIRQKAGDELSKEEGCVYGAMQGMFNAKPDLAVCIGDELLIYEAKLTLDFDPRQMERTKKIGEVWGKLLFQDLGYLSPPTVKIRTLGLLKCKPEPDISWETIAGIAETIYPEGDRTRSVLAHATARAFSS